MIKTPHLLDKMVNLTAIRDLEMLEFSLIQTLHGFFKSRKISLVKLDMHYAPRMETIFGRTKCRVLYEGIVLPEAVTAAAQEMVRSSAGDCIIGEGGSRMIIYYIAETASTRTFLLIQTTSVLKKKDTYMVSGVIQVYRNFCNLLLYSQTDLLTGLDNRKTFDKAILKIYDLPEAEADQIRHDRRAAGPLLFWLAIIDIDHFKEVNDSFGHLCGDQVLMLLAQTLKSVFREDDLIFRYGGEEFVVLLRCQDREGCRIALERLRRTVEGRQFPEAGGITVSIGAVRVERSLFPAQLLKQADQALYSSKNNGRNRTTFYEELAEQGGLPFGESLQSEHQQL